MENILVVLPKNWEINKIRYLQDGDRVRIIDMDTAALPLDETDSLFNYKATVLKENGPTGFDLEKFPVEEQLEDYLGQVTDEQAD
jgi:hypothetical protein